MLSELKSVASCDLFTVIGIDGNFIYVNDRFAGFSGLPANEFTGRSVFDFIYEDDREKARAEFDKWVKGNEHFVTHESRQVSVNGDVHDVFWKVYVNRELENGEVRFYCIATDVSNWNQLQKKLNESFEYQKRNERKMTQLLELNREAPNLSEKELCDRALNIAVEVTNSKVGYLHIVNDDQNTIAMVSWNDEALKYCTADYKSHYPIQEAGIWADCAREKKTVVHNDYSSAENRKGIPEGHFEIVRHMSAPVLDGEQVRLIVGVGNKEDEYDEDDVRQLQYVADEIDKFIMRRRAEESLRELNENLQERVRQEAEKYMKQEKLLIQQSKMASMGEMMSVIAHQWKQPLNILSLFFEAMDDIMDNEEKDIALLREMKVRVHQQIQYMSDTISDFRNFFKPSVKLVVFNPCDLIKEIFHLVEARMKNIEVQVEHHDQQHFLVKGYPNELKQVILNLYSNASDALAKSDQENKRIDIFFESKSSVGIIRIRDNAGGIPVELLPDQLFESHVSTKGNEGSGIGLHISRLIIEEKFAGKIWAHNVEGGAEFVIELPAVEE